MKKKSLTFLAFPQFKVGSGSIFFFHEADQGSEFGSTSLHVYCLCLCMETSVADPYPFGSVSFGQPDPDPLE